MSSASSAKRRPSELISNATRPKFVYGTMRKEWRTEALVLRALIIGFTHIDTAAQPSQYREELVGEAIRLWVLAGKPREQLFIQTKYVGPADQTYPNPAYDLEAPLREQLEQSIYLSLHNLWFDLVYKEDAPGKESTYIDCFLLRFPLRYARQAGLAWKILEEFVPYRLRSLGVSNVSLPVLQDIYARARIKPAVVQNWFCVRTNYDVQVRAFCRQHGIQYQCFGTLTANLGLLMGEAVRGVAEGAEVASAVALYALVMDLGIVVLNGTTDVVHMKKDFDGVERVREWAIENAGEWEKCRAGFAANIGEYD